MSQKHTFSFPGMSKTTGFFLVLSLFFSCLGAQVTILGHVQLNNSPVYNTSITIVSKGVVTRTLNTLSRADFKLELPFGGLYRVYYRNKIGPVLYMEVSADDVPADKYRYLMTYEMNIPLVSHHDEDIDSLAFRKPFHKIHFNGVNRMVADTAYNSEFEASLIKKSNLSNKSALSRPDARVVLSGRLSTPQPTYVLNEKPVYLVGKSGQVLRTTYVNRLGNFAFTGVNTSEVADITVDYPGSEPPLVMTGSGSSFFKGTVAGGKCTWKIGQQQLDLLLENDFTGNIGGKLISSSPREKKFYAEKTVYLANRMHTILKKTTTNLFGTFVFEDIRPDNVYYIGVEKSEVQPGSRIDLLSKEDKYIATLDTSAAGRLCLRLPTSPNKAFNDISISENEMKMDIKATIFGDNVNNPIGKLKILLLNDNYEVIDSAVTDNFGTFKFKYLPFLKRFYLSAENTDNVLDVFKNILIYSSDDNLIKIMTHQKGTKFTYKPLSAEMASMRDIELEDPWLELVPKDKSGTVKTSSAVVIDQGNGRNGPKLIVENILFEANDSKITPQAKEVLDKVVVVLMNNQNLRIEVGAHTDSKGSATANLKLSEERAKIVRQYIVNAGIKPDRIFARGYGESKLLNQCDDQHECSEKEHAQNRRIEFKILGDHETPSNENH